MLLFYWGLENRIRVFIRRIVVFIKRVYLSKLTNPIPFVALRVRIIPKGAKSIVASQPPKVADMELSSAMFFPKELMKK